MTPNNLPDEASRRKILNFLGTQKLAVISTVDPGKCSPESALVAFAEDGELRLYFQTGRHTRKAINLQTNPNVAFVFGLTLAEMLTVQYEGIARPLADDADLSLCRRLFRLKESPTTDDYLNHPSSVLFRVTPTWIGCSDYRCQPPHVVELKDFERG